MIARMWHSVTSAAKADDYLDYLNRTGVPDLQATDGNQGGYILRQIETDQAHFADFPVDSTGAIRSFAGADIESPVLP